MGHLKRFLLVTFLLPSVALACRPLKVLTLEDILLSADKIVVAIALGQANIEEGEQEIWFEKLAVIKGTVEKGDPHYIRIKGRTVNRVLPNNSTPPYADRRLGPPGICYSYDYVIGNQYLLFLKDGSPYWAAFRPTNEEVSGMQDPWVMWVSGFIAGMGTTTGQTLSEK